MQAYLNVPQFFTHVYLVDLSPSLCEVARKRFDRLGWANVTVVCQDARTFRLEGHDINDRNKGAVPRHGEDAYNVRPRSGNGVADLITLSYSLSMIPGLIYLLARDNLSELVCVAAEVPLRPSRRTIACQPQPNSRIDLAVRHES